MITGFEKETQPLTEYEKNVLLPIFLRNLKHKIGAQNSVKNTTIVKKLRQAGYKISDSRVRKIINHIRVNDLIYGIIATSDGYYIAQNSDEMNSYIVSLENRLSAIDAVLRAMKRQKRAYEQKEKANQLAFDSQLPF